MPSVSVIIPNYNRANMVGDTIRNMLEQTLPPKEVIVVDDGSTDNSVQIIKSFGSSVTLLEQTNSGPGAARNAGLAIATGDFIQFMDSDDLASGNKLEIQAKLLEQTKADIAIGPWVRTYIGEGRAQLQELVFQQREPSAKTDLLTLILRGWSTILQSLLFRRETILRGGLFHTDMMNGEDIEYLTRILLAGARHSYSADCITLYRTNSNLKLTGDGISDATRRADRLLYFDRIIGNLNQHQYQLDRITQLLFHASIHDVLYKPGVPSQAELESRLKQWVPEQNSLTIRSVQSYRLWMRRIRSYLGKSPYDNVFRSKDITPLQRQLIEKIGLIPA